MEINTYTRYYIIAIFLVLISGKIKNNACKWCHVILLALAGILIIVGVIFHLKHKNKQKRMRNYE